MRSVSIVLLFVLAACVKQAPTPDPAAKAEPTPYEVVSEETFNPEVHCGSALGYDDLVEISTMQYYAYEALLRVSFEIREYIREAVFGLFVGRMIFYEPELQEEDVKEINGVLTSYLEKVDVYMDGVLHDVTVGLDRAEGWKLEHETRTSQITSRDVEEIRAECFGIIDETDSRIADASVRHKQMLEPILATIRKHQMNGEGLDYRDPFEMMTVPDWVIDMKPFPPLDESY